MSGNIAGWDDNHQPMRIDFIFTNQQLAINKAEIIFDGRLLAPISDHFAYSITINLD